MIYFYLFKPYTSKFAWLGDVITEILMINEYLAVLVLSILNQLDDFSLYKKICGWYINASINIFI